VPLDEGDRYTPASNAVYEWLRTINRVDNPGAFVLFDLKGRHTFFAEKRIVGELRGNGIANQVLCVDVCVAHHILHAFRLHVQGREV